MRSSFYSLFAPIIIFIMFGGPIIIGLLANYIFTDANIPNFRTPPATSHPLTQTGADVQAIGGQGNLLSCSLWWPVDKYAFYNESQPIGLQMRQACITHDYCYRHGHATYGYSQEDCDYRLLQDSLQLCMYLTKIDLSNEEKSIETLKSCQEQAKKITLGVRVGGNSSFKTKKETSTYFEYEPFPVDSKFYKSYRVAAPPLLDNSASRKALYIFGIKPHGLTMTISDESNIAKCNRYLIPTTERWITKAPMVVVRKWKVGKIQHKEDWLVWFQRNSLNNTSSRFIAIAPSRATVKDWKRIFPGFSIDAAVNPKAKGVRKNCFSKGLQIIPKSSKKIASEASAFIHLTGYTKEHCTGFNNIHECRPRPYKLAPEDDPTRNRSLEFHTAPGLESIDGLLKLVSLRVGSCILDSSQLCISDHALPTSFIEPKQKVLHSFQDPLAVRDQINSKIKWLYINHHGEKGVRVEPERYRNFHSPPIAMKGSSDNTVLGWLRRGSGKLGIDYKDKAVLRRASHNKKREGGSAGGVELIQLKEENEPLIVLGRTTNQPRLYSFTLGEKVSNRGIFYWNLPLAQKSNRNNKFSKPAFRNKLNCNIKKKDKRIPYKIGYKWLERVPTMVAHNDGSGTVIMSKMITSSYKTKTEPLLKLMALEITLNDQCHVHLIDNLKELNFPELHKADDFRLVAETKADILRETPLLVWPSLDNDKLEIALPFRNKAWRMVIDRPKSK